MNTKPSPVCPNASKPVSLRRMAWSRLPSGVNVEAKQCLAHSRYSRNTSLRKEHKGTGMNEHSKPCRVRTASGRRRLQREPCERDSPEGPVWGRRSPCHPPSQPRTLVSTSARQSLRNWSKSPWLLRWFTIMATSCGSPAPAPAPPGPLAPGPAPGPGGGGGGCGCGGGGGGAGGGGCGCGLVAMAARAVERASPGGQALRGRRLHRSRCLREANGMLLRNQRSHSNPGSEKELRERRKRR